MATRKLAPAMLVCCWTGGPLLVLIALVAGVNALEIDPETGAYNGLVVAISETALPEGATWTEQERVLQDIKVRGGGYPYLRVKNIKRMGCVNHQYNTYD